MKTALRKVSWLAVLAAGLSITLVAPAVASANQLTPAAAKPRSVVFYTIVSWHTGKCVDDPGGSQTSAIQLQQFTCNGLAVPLNQEGCQQCQEPSVVW